MRHILSFLTGLLLLALVAAPAHSAELSPAVVYKQSLPSVAFVLGAKLDEEQTLIGTAFVVSADQRLLITCHHLIRDIRTVELIFPQRDASGKVLASRDLAMLLGLRHKARVLAVDPGRDLVLLQVEKMPETARALTLAPAEPEPGEELAQIGCPAVSEALWIYSHGRVRATYQRRWTSHSSGDFEQRLLARVIESTMLGNGGDSGAPVLNSRGELVGMHQGRITQANAMAFAISVEEIRVFVKENTPKPVAKELPLDLEALFRLPR